MTGEAGRDEAWRHRFPGFSVVGQADHWDPVTRDVVMARLEPPRPLRFMPEHLRPAAHAVVAQLIDADDEMAAGLLSSIDARLDQDETDGYHFDDMPIDHEAWTRALTGLDEEARDRFSTGFADATHDQQHDLLDALATSTDRSWHGMPPEKVFNLLLRYVCTAFYAHPSAWDEIGFSGPAYPRGYKNPGINSTEPFEVSDAMPHMDPTVSSAP